MRDTLMVQVSVGRAMVDRVELRLDGALLVELIPPYSYVWDTRAYAERAYALTAVAIRGTTEVYSRELTVVVDRTSPSVSSRTPRPDATNIWVGRPIAMTFSEPVIPTTVTDSSVTVATFTAEALPKTRMLSADATALTLQLTAGPSVLPATISVQVGSTITDRAGNPMVPDRWSFAAPAGAEAGAGAEVPLDEDGAARVLAVSPDGTPFVAFVGNRLEPGRLIVTTWDEAAWRRLSPPLNLSPTAAADAPAMAVAADRRPVVAWREGTEIVVSRWDGAAWARLGTSFTGPSIDPQRPSIALDSSGQPVVAWWDGYSAWNVHRWDGTTWVRIGAPMPGSSSYGTQVLALDSMDRPVVAWTGAACGVARWDGGAWVRLGAEIYRDPSLGCSAVAVDLDAADNVYATILMAGGTYTPFLQVRRWTGTAWADVGSSVYSRSDISMAVTRDGTPYVASYNSSTAAMRGAVVERVVGGVWQSVGTWLGWYRPTVTMFGDDVPALVIDQPGASSTTLRVFRSNAL